MLHLLISILIGLLAYAITNLFTEQRIAALVGVIVGILWFMSGGM